MRLAVRRLAAWLVDWLCILAWVGVTAAVGVPLYLAGALRPDGVLLMNAVAALVVVVPVVLATALLESRRSSATPGKRLLRLEVRTADGVPTFGRALLRNGLKLGAPWLLGHAAVYAIVLTSAAQGSAPVWVGVLTAAAYVLPLVYVVTLFLGTGRTVYDRVAGTDVTRRTGRVAADRQPR